MVNEEVSDVVNEEVSDVVNEELSGAVNEEVSDMINEKMSVNQLKEICRVMGLSVSGNKTMLISRINSNKG